MGISNITNMEDDNPVDQIVKDVFDCLQSDDTILKFWTDWTEINNQKKLQQTSI